MKHFTLTSPLSHSSRLSQRVSMVALALVMFLTGINASAQNTLSGRVLDASNSQPLPFATIAVLSPDSSVISGTVADENGTFSLKISPKGGLMSFSFVGFNTAYKTISSPLPKSVEVSLSPSSTTLQTVQIVAKTPIIEQQMDKLVMNVSQSAFAQGNNAMDLLRKAPGVSIDKDGNVKLNGQQVEVWVDGRPSQLDGKSLEALLRATDGSTIDKIEVIANPSAKYDAAGQAGIINIKTKRSFIQGFNGSINLEGGAMGFSRKLEYLEPGSNFFFDQSLSLNLNYRTEKSNTFLQVSENTQQIGVDVQSCSDLNNTGIDFIQKASSRYDVNATTANLKLGNDWFINKKNTLGVIFTLPFYRMHQWADTNENRSFQMVDNAVSHQVTSNASTDYRFTQYMGNLNYTHIFDEAKAAEVTANLDYMHYVNLSDNPLDNYYLLPTQDLSWATQNIIAAERVSLSGKRIVDVYSAKADWQSLVFGRFMMEAGGKWALSRTDNEMTRVNMNLLNNIAPQETTSFFDYNEHIGALYTTLAGQLAQGWTAKVGLRGEYTYAYNSDNSVCQNYFDLFPTLYAGYNTPDMMKRFSLSYTRRIQRPNYMQLNPFRNFVDAHTSNMGNPDLKPSYSHTLNLSAGFGQYVTLSGTFMKSLDIIGYNPQLDPATGDQTLYADNIGQNTLLGGSLTLSELPLGKAVTFMLSAQLYDFRSVASAQVDPILGYQSPADDFSTHAPYSSTYACLTWNIPQQWKLQLDGFVTSPITQGYMHVGWNYSANFAVKKTAFDGRFLFSLSLNDIFRTMNNSFSILSNGVEMSHYNQRYVMQKVTLGLQWNFGTAQKPLRQRNVGNLDEADRTAKSGM